MANVLVIEDNSANFTLAAFLLEKMGHTVVRAFDGESGVAQARVIVPDLILMDIQLPGMDGCKATAILKGDSLTSSIPVVALTVLDDYERIKVAGCDGYIEKPLRYQTFCEVVQRVLGKSGVMLAY